ncbi:MAG: hypothetical protein R3E89_09980 [Thiolinea sp.]
MASANTPYHTEKNPPHQVTAAILAGQESIENIRDEDLEYVADLGLITTRSSIAISNRIYQEIIPREVAWAWQSTITKGSGYARRCGSEEVAFADLQP